MRRDRQSGSAIIEPHAGNRGTASTTRSARPAPTRVSRRTMTRCLRLLALADWQCGDGALASVAPHQARDADPGNAIVLVLSRVIELDHAVIPHRPASSRAMRARRGPHALSSLSRQEVPLPSIVPFCF